MKTLNKITRVVYTLSKASIVGFVLGMASFPVLAGSIADADSAHNFSAQGWTGGEICIACHTPHNAQTGVADAPLWNHNLSAVASYALYSSATLNASATIGQPTGTSKLCLSCHDGTVALDNSPGGVTIAARANIGGDTDGLSDDHPISFDYTAALASADGALHDPTTKTVTIGSGADSKTGTIADVMLIDGQVQCATCHDVHNKFTTPAVLPATTNYLLRVANNGSNLCLTCHAK